MINNPNNRQAVAANILKCLGQDIDIQKGGAGSGRHSLHEHYDIKFHDDESPLYKNKYTGRTSKRNLIATHRKTGEQYILGTHKRSSEGYSSNPNKSRINDKSRKVNHFNWEVEGVKKVIHPDITVGSRRMEHEKDLYHDTGNYHEPTALQKKKELEQVYDKYHKKDDEL